MDHLEKMKIKILGSDLCYEFHASAVPQINSLIKIEKENNDEYFRVHDLMYTFYENSSDSDCVLYVTKSESPRII